LTRETWTSDLINNVKKDRLVYLYSTENINFHQRVVAHQISILTDYLTSLKYLGNKIEIFAYDTNKEGFPKHSNIYIAGAPPMDNSGREMDSEGKNRKNLPAIYFFKAGGEADEEALRW
jgi:hypothetical protein